MTADKKTLETVSTMVRGALLDPDNPESGNRLRLSAAKLRTAKIDIHGLTFGKGYHRETDYGLSYDNYMKTLATLRHDLAKASRRIERLTADLAKARGPSHRLRSGGV
jgi:hypothetical protein